MHDVPASGSGVPRSSAKTAPDGHGRDWRAFFDGLGHHSPLYAEQSALYVESLADAVGLRRDQRVLDFGCGFGFVAALLAPRVAEVRMWDVSPNMRSVAEQTTAGLPNVGFHDLSDGPSGARPSQERPAFDLVLVNSVAQYLRPDELWAWLRRWKAMLAPRGRIVLSDLIPPDHSGLADVVDLLRLGRRHGAPLGAAREALGGFGRYWRTSRAVPLTRISSEDLARHAVDAGLDTAVLRRNLTHFSKRWAAVLSISAASSPSGPSTS